MICFWCLVYDKDQNNYRYPEQMWARRHGKILHGDHRGPEADNVLYDGCQHRHSETRGPGCVLGFLVFAGFDMASRGEQNYVTITDKTKAHGYNVFRLTVHLKLYCLTVLHLHLLTSFC